jgi:hypothetical protein
VWVLGLELEPVLGLELELELVSVLELVRVLEPGLAQVPHIRQPAGRAVKCRRW